MLVIVMIGFRPRFGGRDLVSTLTIHCISNNHSPCIEPIFKIGVLLSMAGKKDRGSNSKCSTSTA